MAVDVFKKMANMIIIVIIFGLMNFGFFGVDKPTD